MTLLHEIGHHLLPAPADEDNSNSQTHRVVLSEALANTFCDALLAPEERPWLFAKARLMQPAAYLAYFVPYILAKLGSASRFGEAWRNIVRQSMHREALHARHFFRELEMMEFGMHGHIPPLVASAETYLALYGLFGTSRDFPRRHFRHVLRDHKPCAIGVFEEFEMRWATEAGLLRLLEHPEPSVQAEAFRMLDKKEPRDAATEQALVQWCDANVRSKHQQAAQRAWESPFTDREEERLDRYRAVAAGPHEEIVAELPTRVHGHCLPEDARSIIEPLLEDSRFSVRLAAVREMSALLYDAGDVPALQTLFLKNHCDGWSPLWDDPQVNAAEMPEELLFLLSVWDHPKCKTTKWTAGFLFGLVEKRVAAFYRMKDRDYWKYSTANRPQMAGNAKKHTERIVTEARDLLLNGNSVAWPNDWTKVLGVLCDVSRIDNFDKATVVSKAHDLLLGEGSVVWPSNWKDTSSLLHKVLANKGAFKSLLPELVARGFRDLKLRENRNQLARDLLFSTVRGTDDPYEPLDLIPFSALK